jgi:hypothetical protein
VQGIAEAQLGFRFGPYQMRAILRDPANGTAPAATETTAIGVMPDLRLIIDNVLNVAPDVYVRDFVGDIGTANDPAPNPADFLDWTNFRRFIHDNNNVTWRNFNVVDNVLDTDVDPIPEVKFKALEFVSPGAPRQAVPMQLEIVGKLPPGGRAYLEVPGYYADMLQERGIRAHTLKGGQRSLVPIKQFGQMRLPQVLYAAKIRNRMRLLVHIPESQRHAAYNVAVRQFSEDEEVGRVTWRLQPKARTSKEEKGFRIYKDKAGEYLWRLLADKATICDLRREPGTRSLPKVYSNP